MFQIGDKVVYPMHGAGTIEAIEEREVLGQLRKYYVMRLPIGDMKVMVPISNVQDIGLRQVIDSQSVERVLCILSDRSNTMTATWNRRYRANMDKIRSGNIFEVAEVVKNLVLREKDKGLSTGEKKMLENARQILISELVLAGNQKEEDVNSLIQGVMA
ncbi:MAG TPA: CarD family transcriptional regulator [Candidatus Deferrimicrobium sp.]|jgi:CarD family transcriptional regulator|nr:CarD family transcriptional regulator [Candidatus Deferrimicrobium sp.]